MTRGCVLGWALLVGTSAALVETLLASNERAYTLAIGRLDPTELEQQECYFPFSAGAMLVLHPKGEACVVLRELVGRTGKLVFVLDEDQP